MMDCANYKELAGLRDEDLSAEERAELSAHLDACEVCQVEQRDDHELLSLVDRMPSLESGITAGDIRRLDGLTDEPVREAAQPAAPSRRWSTVVAPLMAVAAAVALALLIVPGMFDTPGGETQRLKGPATDEVFAASVDLQFSVETSLGGLTALSVGEEGAVHGSDQAIIFGVLSDAEGSLVLVEQTPQGGTSIIAPAPGTHWQLGESGSQTLVNDQGRQLSYRPDAGDGTYTYSVLLLAPESRSVSPADLDSLLRGTAVDGVSVLASDSFTVQWSLGETGEGSMR